MGATKLIEQLRRLLGSGATNDEVTAYFLERVGLDEQVLEISKPVLEPTLAQAIVQSFCLEEVLAEVLIYRCRGTDFRHGAVRLSDGIAMFFFFADTQQGFTMLDCSEGQRIIRFGIGTAPTLPGPALNPLVN